MDGTRTLVSLSADQKDRGAGSRLNIVELVTEDEEDRVEIKGLG